MRRIWVLVSVIIALLLLSVIGYSYIFSKISLKEHYNVRRGTVIWHAVFKNTSISKVPVIKSIHPPQYSYSFDNPHISYSITMEYKSELQIGKLIPIVLDELRKNGFEINLGKVHCGEWAWRLSADNGKIEYNGTSPKEECMFLEFQEIENLVKLNIGIAD